MEFCSECGSMMMPEEGFFKCRDCDVVIEIKEDYTYTENQEDNEIPVIEDGNANVLPTIEEECPECGHNKAGWWLRQLRSADESETRFFRCLECQFTWREYD
ncbi:DNA-directed RNA polymerase subunit M/Transcription elongation factor TFIIS [Methanonatronarchaeum thermophilum]|uniref:Transcription factor S n=1 Tax=Methanonatronarchaeum thermophilum TaxID=1927129 RepID=A0A1Y3GBA6_9EURY|nr:transcription factor S [Methanonatronarchaeum thermophilum]OUJ18742.1 DNA-directed RNA polymerase subunit M/Transcription elongation factor TFIIS [Methanonatronarchaeum thermophilum]